MLLSESTDRMFMLSDVILSMLVLILKFVTFQVVPVFRILLYCHLIEHLGERR